MKERFMSPGDVYLCDFRPVVGSEQDGIRPAIVVSNNKCCAFSDVVYVTPITSQIKKQLPQHYNMNSDLFPFLETDSVALCEQTRPVSKLRLKEKLGNISLAELYEIICCIKKNFPL